MQFLHTACSLARAFTPAARKAHNTWARRLHPAQGTRSPMILSSYQKGPGYTSYSSGLRGIPLHRTGAPTANWPSTIDRPDIGGGVSFDGVVGHSPGAERRIRGLRHHSHKRLRLSNTANSLTCEVAIGIGWFWPSKITPKEPLCIAAIQMASRDEIVIDAESGMTSRPLRTQQIAPAPPTLKSKKSTSMPNKELEPTPAEAGAAVISSEEPEPEILPPKEDDALLSHLLVVSRISPGNKLLINPLSVDQGGITAWFWRMWKSEGRDKTLKYLQRLFDASIERLAVLYNMDQKLDMLVDVRAGYASQFVTNIRGAVNGLSALLVTYGSDPLTVSRLETMRNGITIRLQTYQ